jgi:hypothetical protein
LAVLVKPALAQIKRRFLVLFFKKEPLSYALGEKIVETF